MKVITFVTQKGGVGKTTLAASVAVAAQEAGEKVFMIDLDPQGSLMGWGKRRQADTPPVDQTTPAALAGAVTGLAQNGYSLAVIDTAGLDTAASAAAMRVSDLALIPSRPSLLDIEAAKPTMKALTGMDKKFAFILNAAAPGKSSRSTDAANALGLLNMLAQPFIAQRIDHMDAIAFGLGVTEHDPASKAAEEIRALWTWIKKKLGDDQ
jgi:chromosome partitioning protein